VEIEPDDTVGTLYFNKLFPLGVEALVEAVRLVKEGKAPKIVQDESQATYEGLVKQSPRIDWSAPYLDVYRQIRGTNPAPGALTSFAGADVKVFDSEVRPGDAGEPGTVVAIDAAGIHVAAKDGAVVIKRLQPRLRQVEGGGVRPTTGLQVGGKLGE
jgi:methionyl-tRNA formyltransferase